MQALKIDLADHFDIVGVCPHCNEPLYTWKLRDTDNGVRRSLPACMSCHYSEMQRKETYMIDTKHQESIKQLHVNYMRQSSIVTDSGSWNCTFDNYEPNNQETMIAKRKSVDFCTQYNQGSKKHLMLIGGVGVGKTHLAMSILKKILEQSHYTKKCLFINYQELLNQLRYSMSDEQVKKLIVGGTMNEIKKADVLVIDDVGSNLGQVGQVKKASDYDTEIMTSITESRQNLATVFTTNLSSEQIKYAYGNRVLSRMIRNSNGYLLTFKDTKDRRNTIN